MIATLAVAPLTLVPPGALAQGPAGDFVTADTTDCQSAPEFCRDFGDIFVADVGSGPAGENATGTVQYTSGFGRARAFTDAQVSCLNVAGDTAIIGFTGKIFAFVVPQGVFTSGLFRVVDRGGPDSSLDTFQIARGAFSETPIPGPRDCSAFPGSFSDIGQVSVNEVGDIVVHDAPALPTSKEQCRNGGWRNFGNTFKNQGECVAFAQRGPKP